MKEITQYFDYRSLNKRLSAQLSLSRKHTKRGSRRLYRLREKLKLPK